MATIQIAHFDQLGTGCNYYSQEYRITGALPYYERLCAPSHINIPINTYWDRDEMDAISQTTLSKAFSWMKMLEFRLKIHWSLF